MGRAIAVSLASVLVVGSTLGQEKPKATDDGSPPVAISRADRRITPRSVARHNPLVREYKAAYLIRQLELSDEQTEKVEGLIETVLKMDGPQIDLEAVRTLVAEMQEAIDAGDEEKKAEISARLREMGKSRDTEPEFYDNLGLILNDEQKKRLKAAEARLKRNPSGGLRPVDVFEILEGQKLDKKQQEQLEQLKVEFREKIKKEDDPNDKRRARMMQDLIERAARIANTEQRKTLEHEIELLRTDRIPNIQAMDKAARAAGGERRQAAPGQQP